MTLSYCWFTYKIVHGLCTVCTWALYSYYKGFVQKVQRLCIKSTEALYYSVLTLMGGRLHIETLMLASGKLSRKRLQEILWAMVRRFIKVC